MSSQPIHCFGLDEVIQLHGVVMGRTGSNPRPLHSPEGLESALHRPRAASYYEDADLVRQASLLAVSVSVSVAVGVGEAQAFLDGNRRTAYAVLDTFMRINGYAYAGEPLELARRLEAVGGRAGSLDDATDGFESWLRQHIAPV